MGSGAVLVSLLLTEGDRQGQIVARLDGYECRAIGFGRADWYRVVEHPEVRPLLAQPGVYVLVGSLDENPRRQRVYVGQADRLRARLENHLSNPGKSWWSRTYIFAGGLQPTSTSWLEAELIEDAKEGQARGRGRRADA